MEYRKIGKHGLRVSALSIGGWLTFGGSIDDGTTAAILRKSIEAGINFIDLADVYAAGAAERAAGVVLRDHRRSDLVISSKVFWPMSEDPNDRGLSRKHIHESIDRSLERLGTDYLDIYFCHREDPETSIEETTHAMDDLVRRGKILYWGTSVWSAKSLMASHEIAGRRGLYGPIVEQPQYNLVHRDIEREVTGAVRALGMGLVVWSPLAGGLLSGKYNDGVPKDSRGARTRWLEANLNPATIDRVRHFSGIAREMGVTPAALALAWLLERPAVASVITGATRPEQLAENLKAMDVRIPDDARAAIEELFPA